MNHNPDRHEESENHIEQKANDGIVNEAVLKSVADQLTIDKQAMTIETLRKLEPILFKDILRSVAEFRKTCRNMGLNPRTLDQIQDLFATAMIRGFLIYKTAVSKIDAKKLHEFYALDWDSYCDKLIDMYHAKKAKLVEAEDEE